ncbi:MAG: hypothetical protein HY558_07030 [Euryarchaeota archaeon]|nr:hypothetical protein [Euryarchaeota archaeon]
MFDHKWSAVYLTSVVGLALMLSALPSALGGASATVSSNVTITQNIAVALSDGLTYGVSFGELITLPASPLGANNTAGGASSLSNYTGGANSSYWVNISTDTNVRTTLCFGANDSLKTPGGAASIANASYRWNTTVVNSSGFNTGGAGPMGAGRPIIDGGTQGLGTAYNVVNNSTNMTPSDASNHTIIFRLGLNITAGQETGSYYNTLIFKAVRENQGCT